MKKQILYYSIFFILLTVQLTSIKAQCSFDSNDGGAVTDANFASTTSTFAGAIGNSFTACGSGTLITLGVLATGAGSGITITIYEGAGRGGTNLGSVSSISVTAAASINDRNNIDFSGENIILTSGNTYTWSVTTGTISTRATNSSIYSDGIAYSGATGFSTNDFLFSITLNGVVPVELTSFTALINNDTVELRWETATEVNNYGFEVERQQSENGTQNTEWEAIGFVQGHGNSNSPKNYEFIDHDPPAGNLQYRLKQIDTDGTYEYYSLTAEVDATITSLNDERLPEQFHLSQNYPNPFNPTTTIKYNIPAVALSPVEGQHVSLKIYDVLGNEVSQLVNKLQAPGIYQVEFDASNLPSNIYFYTLSARGFSETKKLVLLK